jgi:hypothetical protein
MSNDKLRQKSLVYDKAYKFAIRVVNAYKECLETKYWLSLLKDTDY